MTKQADILAYIFDGKTHLLSKDLSHWVETSARFAAFVETYRDKIRKKIRVIQNPESFLDLRCELETAYRLLNDRRLALAYEPYASAKLRGPDFAVTYRANLTFNIEVARIRVEESMPGAAALERKQERVVSVLLDKLGQMQPAMPNLLLIQTREELAESFDLGALMQKIKIRAESKGSTLFAASRYSNSANFFRDFLHLNGVLLWAAGTQLWINKQARLALPEKVARLVSVLIAGGTPV